jgi:Uncharacterized protein conserved in bacteria
VQLIVLGMHRSGTSILARTLNLMGAYFGPEGISTGANNENPKGFWERRDVRQLNDSILHAVGADWNRIARFEPDSLPGAVVDDFVQRASRLVLEMDAHRPWFIKEPRLCLLLPLWLRVLEIPVTIRILRHPVEVAASLRTRNAIPIPAGLALWEKYVRAADEGARGLPMAQVSHRRLVTEPMREIERLYQQLEGFGIPGLRMPSEREISVFVDQALYRERDSHGDLLEYARAPQVALFDALQSGSERLPKPTPAGRQQLLDYEATLPPLQPKMEVSKAPATVDVALREKVAAREQEAKLLREAVAKLEAATQQRDERLAGEMINIGRLQGEATARERELATLRDSANSLREELRARDDGQAVLAGELEAARRLGGEVQAALSEREARIGWLERELEESTRRLEANASNLVRKLEWTEHSLGDRFGELAKMTQLLLAQDANVERMRRELEANAYSLRARTVELQAARADLAGIRASRSWRAMAPLRAIARKVGLLGGRPARGTKERVLVEQSGLFDKAWYLEAYPDVASSGIDPIEHYLMFGALEQRSPGPDFNAADYLRLHPDVAEAGANPLIHYVLHGRDEGRRLA